MGIITVPPREGASEQDTSYTTGSIKQTVYSRRWGRVGETGGPAHSDGVAICRSSNAYLF